MQRFGEKLYTLRKQQNLTQAQLAQQTGIGRSYIGDLESGKKKPGAELVLKIADFFGVPVETLMRDELDLDTDEYPS